MRYGPIPFARLHGFSLVELSIVLVILGLLVGGILSGQALIRAAELRSVPADFARYQAAVHSFRDKYFALPGDMANATNFWGRVGGGAGQCAAPQTNSDTGLPTCNGDGNGALSNAGGYVEYFRFWEHLAAAGLIEGTYTGVAGSGSTYHAVIGQNTPVSRLSTRGFSAWTWDDAYVASQPNIWPGDYNRVMNFGSQHSSSTTLGTSFKAEEAWNIDTKIDDGVASTGKVRHPYNNTAGCISGTNYDLASTTVACWFVFMNAY